MESPFKVIESKADFAEACQEVQGNLAAFKANPAAFGPESHGVVLEHLCLCAQCRAYYARIHPAKGT